MGIQTSYQEQILQLVRPCMNIYCTKTQRSDPYMYTAQRHREKLIPLEQLYVSHSLNYIPKLKTLAEEYIDAVSVLRMSRDAVSDLDS